VLDFLRSIYSNRRLLKELVLRDLKARYVGSSMGFFWSVIFPILNLIVYTFVFKYILNVRFSDQAGVRDVAIWMLAGIVVWSAFAETLSRATNCLVDNANLIQKVVFPAGVLPVYLAISSLINMTIGIPVVLLGVVYFGYLAPGDETPQEEVALVGVFDPSGLQEPEAPALNPREVRRAACNQCDHEEDLICPNDGSAMRVLQAAEGPALEDRGMSDLALGPSLLWVPLLLVLQGLFMTGLGLFLSAFNLILRDTFHLVGVFVMVWMFGTPIFYPPEMITDPKHGGKFDFILEYNPMHWLIECYRSVLLYDMGPNTILLGKFALTALVVLFIGATFFSSQRKRFPDLL
jgi:ABC-type polysaccharide/polyol phosphate export permease